MRAVVLGARGQVGRAVAVALPGALALSHTDLDITRPAAGPVDWSRTDVVVNAAAYTDVDAAETPEGRRAAWEVNAVGPQRLAELALRHGFVLVHFSTEYVFDGRADAPVTEDHPVGPLNVYGATKAAGDLAVRCVPRHLIIRPTWVVGEGRNFVRTMAGLAARGVSPTVVADQVGRLTFADDLAAAVAVLLGGRAEPGTYHVTGGGPPASWAAVARAVFDLSGRADLSITECTTAEWTAGRPAAAARPANSVLALDRAARAGVPAPDWRRSLADYLGRAG